VGRAGIGPFGLIYSNSDERGCVQVTYRGLPLFAAREAYDQTGGYGEREAAEKSDRCAVHQPFDDRVGPELSHINGDGYDSQDSADQRRRGYDRRDELSRDLARGRIGDSLRGRRWQVANPPRQCWSQIVSSLDQTGCLQTSYVSDSSRRMPATSRVLSPRSPCHVRMCGGSLSFRPTEAP
jgi:hypothetical protein